MYHDIKLKNSSQDDEMIHGFFFALADLKTVVRN